VAIVDFITEAKGAAGLPGIITLGYISSSDESLAMGVISAKGIPPLKEALNKENNDSIKAAAEKSLGYLSGFIIVRAATLSVAQIVAEYSIISY
jgi:hypothetical protein